MDSAKGGDRKKFPSSDSQAFIVLNFNAEKEELKEARKGTMGSGNSVQKKPHFAYFSPVCAEQ